MNRKRQLAAFAVLAFAFTLGVRGASRHDCAGKPALLVGQTLQLTANGAVVPGGDRERRGAHVRALHRSVDPLHRPEQPGSGRQRHVRPTCSSRRSPSGRSNPVERWRRPRAYVHARRRRQDAVLGQRTTPDSSATGRSGGFAVAPQFVHNDHERHQGDHRRLLHVRDAARPHRAVLGTQPGRAARQRRQHDRRGAAGAGAGSRARRTTLRPAATTTCALMADRTVRCWGRNVSRAGRRRHRHDSPVTQPHPVSGMNGAVALSLGGYHSCALLQDATVQCWGESDFGQIGARGPRVLAGPRHRERHRQRRAPSPPASSHSCARALGRHGPMLGQQRVRPAWRRHDDEFGHAGAGAGHRQSSRGCRSAPAIPAR